eukprot:3817970-Rhodomonas_salina.2
MLRLALLTAAIFGFIIEASSASGAVLCSCHLDLHSGDSLSHRETSNSPLVRIDENLRSNLAEVETIGSSDPAISPDGLNLRGGFGDLDFLRGGSEEMDFPGGDNGGRIEMILGPMFAG